MSPDQQMRMTRQREAILEAVQGMRTHPTAEEVHARVRRRLPRIGLATVYRNLEKLADLGLIGRMEAAGRRRRFDADTSPHHHARCEACGRVADVSQSQLEGAPILVHDVAGYEVTGYRLELLGRCPQCRGK